MIIVIGGSGYIGRHLCEFFSNEGTLLAGTYYSTPIKNMHYFDMKNPNITSLEIDLEKAKYAIICSAIARIDECKIDEEKSNKINVEGTKKLIEQLFQLNIVPIYFSSDQVFDGKKGDYDEKDQRNPVNLYGRQKMIVENFLMKSKKPHLIVRFSKIFGLEKKDRTIITSWIKQLQNDEIIRCADDQILSFTYIRDIVRALDTSIKNNLRGCYNISPPESFSRLELAKIVKKQLGLKKGKIVSCSINDFGFLDIRPNNTSLNPTKFIKATNFEFTTIQTCLDILRKSCA